MQGLFANQNQQINNILQTVGLADVAVQGYRAYQSGNLPEFVQDQYNTNFMLRLFYDGSKDKTLKEILNGFGINLDNNV